MLSTFLHLHLTLQVLFLLRKSLIIDKSVLLPELISTELAAQTLKSRVSTLAAQHAHYC